MTPLVSASFFGQDRSTKLSVKDVGRERIALFDFVGVVVGVVIVLERPIGKWSATTPPRIELPRRALEIQTASPSRSCVLDSQVLVHRTSCL